MFHRKPASLPERVGFFLVPQFAMLSFASALEPLRSANRLSGRALYSWHILSKDGAPVLASNGIPVVPEAGIEQAPALDALVVCAGIDAHLYEDRAVFAWLRRMARRPQPVTWAEHEAWLAAVAADANRILLIGEHAGQPVGVVRFDVRSSEAEVSIYRVPTTGERGLGVRLLRAAERWLAARRPDVTRLTAEVLADNQRSHRLFRSAGYQTRSWTYEKEVQA